MAAVPMVTTLSILLLRELSWMVSTEHGETQYIAADYFVKMCEAQDCS